MSGPSGARQAEDDTRMAGRRAPANIRGMTSLVVDGISNKMIVVDMEALIKKYRKVCDIYFPRDKKN